MSEADNQSDEQQSWFAWIMLSVSTIALLVLCVWALSNQDELFGRGSNSGQNAITNQSDSESQRTLVTATGNESTQQTAEIDTNPIAESRSADTQSEPQRAEIEPKDDDVENTKSAADGTIVENVSDESVAVEKPLSRDQDQSLAESTITRATAEDDLEKQAAEELADAQAESEQLATEQEYAQRLADGKAAVDEALAATLAPEMADEELVAELAADRKLTEENAAEEALVTELVSDRALAEDNAAREKQQVEQLVALPKRSIEMVDIIEEQSQVAAETESAFEKTRREELAQLPEIAADVRFIPNDIEVVADARQSMERMFELLFLYSETTVTVQVATNEYEIDGNNELISRERALVIINYLIDRGLDEQRFRIRAMGKQELPPESSHQVAVIATVIDND